MPTVKEVIERLQTTYDPTNVIAIDIWGTPDVIGRANKLGMVITQEQAEEVIEEVDRKKDNSIGITWDTLDFWIEELYPELIFKETNNI